jgi:hypothetical protein
MGRPKQTTWATGWIEYADALEQRLSQETLELKHAKRMADKEYHRNMATQAENTKLRAALEKLARLGNGNQYGNSDGNVIAQKALKAGHATGLHHPVLIAADISNDPEALQDAAINFASTDPQNKGIRWWISQLEFNDE